MIWKAFSVSCFCIFRPNCWPKSPWVIQSEMWVNHFGSMSQWVFDTFCWFLLWPIHSGVWKKPWSVGCWFKSCSEWFDLIYESIILGLRTQWVVHLRTALRYSIWLVKESFLVQWVSWMLIQELLWAIQFGLWGNHSWCNESVDCWFKIFYERFSLVCEGIILGAMSQLTVDSRTAMSDSVWFVRESFLVQWVSWLLIQELLWAIQFGLWGNHSWCNESVDCWFKNCYERFSLVCEGIILGAMSQLTVDSRTAMSDSVWFVRESFLVQWVSWLLIQELLWAIQFGLWGNHSWCNESVDCWFKNCYERFSLVCEGIILGSVSQLTVDSRIAMSDSIWLVKESFVVQWFSEVLTWELIQSGLWIKHSWFSVSVGCLWNSSTNLSE